MRVSEFKTYLEDQFTDVDFYNGTIDKNKVECIGLYLRGSAGPAMALGGPTNNSYGQLPISILIHWGEDSDKCESKANEVYQHLCGLSNIKMGDRRIVSVNLLDSSPIDLQRDPNNICEMVIRVIIIYDKEVQ